MANVFKFPTFAREGIHVDARVGVDELVAEVRRRVGALAHCVEVARSRHSHGLRIRLTEECAHWLSPDGGTLEVAALLGLEPSRTPADLEAEIVISMLISARPLRFTSTDELASALRVRLNIVAAARETRLDFETGAAERPDDFDYDEERGFVLREGRSLVDALRRATQPRYGGRRYSFSCWRATEYVALLAVALEAAAHHPELYARLAQQAERRALKAAAFDRAFFHVHGSNAAPLATRYFVAGDRTWFRNPDRASSQVAGFEGSYTFYLGGGRFADFWHEDRTYSLAAKCLTLFYWRQAVERDARGEPCINEGRVELLVAAAAERASEAERILVLTERVQDPPERFGGGCIDPTRDHVRPLHRGGAHVDLPDVDGRAQRGRMLWERGVR